MEAPVVSNLTEGLSGPALNTQKEKVEQGPASEISQGARIRHVQKCMLMRCMILMIDITKCLLALILTKTTVQ